MSTELQLHDAVVFLVPQLVSSALLAVLHWFPWRGQPHGARHLRRTTAYALGTSVVVGVPVATMLLTAALGLHYSQVFLAALLVANTLVSGATVNVAHWIDARAAVGHNDLAEEAGYAHVRR